MSLTKQSTYVINGRILTSGETQVSVKGITGRCVFYRHVRNVEGEEWLDVWSMSKSQWRSVAVDRVTRVHRTVIK